MTASAIAVAALWIAGSMPGWLLVVLAALTIAACALPDTVIPALFVAAYATSWVALTDRGVTIWLLAAALGIGGFHLATAAAGTIPPRGDLPRAVAHRWIRHSGTIAGITLAVWLLALIVRRHRLSAQRRTRRRRPARDRRRRLPPRHRQPHQRPLTGRSGHRPRPTGFAQRVMLHRPRSSRSWPSTQTLAGMR